MIKALVPNINIKENFKKIFTQRVIKECRNVQGHNEEIENFILVVDDYTLNLVNSFLEIYDLIEVGIIKIDNLFKIRAPVQGSHAIYFIKPSEKSINQVLNDFKSNKKNEIYSFAHVVFCTQPDNFILDKISSNNNLCYSLLNLKVAHLDLITHDDSIYNLKIKNDFNLLYFNNFDAKLYQKIKKKCVSLLSLTNGFKDLYLIYSKDKYAHKISNELYLDFKERFNTQNNNLISNNNESSLVIVIVDRINDLFSPLLHDNTYMSQLFEYTETEDFSMNYNNIQKEELKCTLNDKDDIFLTYKYTDLRLCINDINTNYKNLINTIQNQKNNNNNEDAANLINSFPQYKEFINEYLKHINKLKEILNLREGKKKRDNVESLSNQTFMKEFIFATGLDYNLSKPDLSKIDLSIFSDDICFRYAMLAKFCSKLDNDIVNNLARKNNKYLENIEKIRKELFLDEEKPFEHIDFEYDTPDKINNGGLKKFPVYKSRKLLESIYNNDLDLNNFDIKKIGNSNNNKDIKIFQGNKMFANNKNIPNVIFFTLGGMTHNEISQLNKFCRLKNNRFNIICGSTNIYTVQEYLQSLKELKNYKNSNDTFNLNPEQKKKLYMNN